MENENNNNQETKKVPPNRLKLQREKSRLTQSEVARVLELSVASVSRHETSNRGLTREMIEKYASLYKVASAELFVELPTEDNTQEDVIVS